MTLFGWKQNSEASPETTTENTVNQGLGQFAMVDEDFSPNIVQTASGSIDHSTLIAAVKAAGLMYVLNNAGPLNVFAPTSAPFDKLVKRTVEELLKPTKKDDLKNILEYRNYVGNLKTE